MMRRPPRSTLFPTRRSSDLKPMGQSHVLSALSDRERKLIVGDDHLHPVFVFVDDHLRDRSEEHTSELQSRENLVCRLLLEKKKKTKKYRYSNILTVHSIHHS